MRDDLEPRLRTLSQLVVPTAPALTRVEPRPTRRWIVGAAVAAGIVLVIVIGGMVLSPHDQREGLRTSSESNPTSTTVPTASGASISAISQDIILFEGTLSPGRVDTAITASDAITTFEEETHVTGASALSVVTGFYTGPPGQFDREPVIAVIHWGAFDDLSDAPTDWIAVLSPSGALLFASSGPTGEITGADGSVLDPETLLQVGVAVPDLHGQSEIEAANALGDLGFVSAFFEEVSDEVPAGLVIRTSPAAGTTLMRGRSVVVFVSADVVLVPNVVGLAADHALNVMRDSALNPQVELQTLPVGHEHDGVVLSQDPEAGTEAIERSIVVIRVGAAASD